MGPPIPQNKFSYHDYIIIPKEFITLLTLISCMKFICDVMLGKLGRWLRMFGYNTIIAVAKESDKELLQKASLSGRIILTRDKSVKRKGITYYVESKDLEGQLKDVISHFNLKINFPKNTRCPVCNGILEKTEKGPEGIKSDVFWKCQDCGKYYWKGSHWDKILKTIERVK